MRAFVAWWKANVGAGMGKKGRCRDLGTLPYSDAEHLTGMKHQRASDLGKRPSPPAWPKG
jgi:hypothetical protein